MELVRYDDDILYKPTEDLIPGKDDLKDLFEKLKEGITKHKGIGLSANQIGISKNAFVIGDGEQPDSILFIGNCKITNKSEETDILDEGCLTFPGLSIKIRRSKNVRIRYIDQNGEAKVAFYSGMTARCIQHEMMHMQGRPFFEEVTKLKLDMAIKKCHKKTGILYK